MAIDLHVHYVDISVIEALESEPMTYGVRVSEERDGYSFVFPNGEKRIMPYALTKIDDYEKRPLVLHGLGVSSEGPEVNIDKVEAEEYEFVLKPNMTLMLEPNPITPDGRFGIFLGHPFVITKDGNRKLTDFPLELSIAH